MTIREKLEKHLRDHGLLSDDASQVMEIVIKATEDSTDPNHAMNHRWDDVVDDYPKQLFGILWLSVRRQAIKWIDANKPKHFARAMFDEAEPEESCDS